MPRNPNLVPTVITDINGVTRTVHKKPTTGTNATKLPRPASVMAPDEVSTIITALRNGPGFNSLPEGPTMINHIREVLRQDPDPNYLQQVKVLLDQVNSMEDDEVTRSFYRYVLSTLKRDDRDGTRSLVAHRDILSKNPGDSSNFARISKSLREEYLIMPDENGYFPTMEAHLKANKHYDNSGAPSTGMRHSYTGNATYVIAVQKHAENIDALLAYRDAYPPNFDSGYDNFDNKHFEETLEHGALGDGWV